LLGPRQLSIYRYGPVADEASTTVGSTALRYLYEQRAKVNLSYVALSLRKALWAELMEKLGETGLPFAPTVRPEDLFDDLHLQASERRVPLPVTDGELKGETVSLPALPLEMYGHRFGLHQPVPHAGEHMREVLSDAGYAGARGDRW